MVDTIIKLTCCLIGGVLMESVAARFLTNRWGRWGRVLLAVLFGLFMTMPSWIGDENAMLLFPFFAAVFLLFYRGRWYARLTVGISFYSLLLPMNMLLDTANSLGEGARGLLRMLLWAGLWLLARRFAPRDMRELRSPKLWALLGGLSLTPLFTILSFSIWNWNRMSETEWYSDLSFRMLTVRLGSTVLPFTILSTLAVLVAIVVLARHEELVERQKLAEIQAVYYQGLQTEQAEVRIIRHDLRNHIAAAANLLMREDSDGALRYLESLAETEALMGTRQICENPVANAVLSGKAAILESEGMEADWAVSLPASLPVADIDLCALLGNALDNAIEAARIASDKRVTVEARADKGVFMLRVENAVGTTPRREEGRFKTTKADSARHGIGLDSMSEIARRYDGSLEARVENGRFELVAFLRV